MLPELGNFSLILALFFCILQFAAPLVGYYKKHPLYFQLSTFSVIGQFGFLALAMLFLIASFIFNDMTVLYVRDHSHHLLPLIYRMAAAWGGHEGSLLLWCLVLAAWTLAFVIFSNKALAKSSYNNILMTLGLISTGFLVFLFITSNPFKRDFPTEPIVGKDLTPLLQDPGILFHPPSLYLGYVGFAIGFAFAISALLEGKLDKTWAKACRPWIIIPWAYLGCGIVLGSWWAYRELGWGGWWFWDPVENASLLPWLAATALIHSLIVSEKRDVFRGWTILLAIITFGLSLIGTFLVRSGVLVSVHTFASDPTRGAFLLCFLALMMGSAFVLYGLRINRFYQAPNFQLFSRETALLINSVVLLISMFTIILGTLYPIILDSFNLEKISVGEPYFNLVFAPIMLPLLFLMGVAPHINWGQQSALAIWTKLRLNLIISITLAIILPWSLGFKFHWLAVIGLSTGIWVIIATIHYAIKATTLTLQSWAMIIAHLGVAVFVLGVTINKSYSEERQVKILPGESTTLAGYQFTFEKIEEIKAANYNSLAAKFLVQKNNRTSKVLFTEQRVYLSHNQTLSKPGVMFNSFRDLYIVLGTSFADGGWSVRIYYKPAVRWIWFGGFMLLMGGILTLFSRKNRRELKHGHV